MKSYLAGMIFLGLFSMTATAQNRAIGLRLGDPSGITFKQYTGSNNALEINVGRTYTFNLNGLYDAQFIDWYSTNNFLYSNFQYLGFTSTTPMSVQVHYLIQKSISKVVDEPVSGLVWYYGLGGQARLQSYTYNYRYQLTGSNQWYNATSRRLTNVDIGADAILGLEYTLKDVPLSLSLDVTVFVEVLDEPFRVWLQNGLGVKYRF